MTTDQKTPEDPDLERWLAKLGGNGERDDVLADRLRSTVLKQQQLFEDEIDELRLRRGRDELIAKTGAQNSARTSDRRARPFAIAASVFLAATASLIGYQQLTNPPGTSEVELLMYYGDLERPRGGFSTLSIDVDAPLETAQKIADQLRTAHLPFELRRAEDQTLRLAVAAVDASAVEELRQVTGQYGIEIDAPGYFVLILE